MTTTNTNPVSTPDEIDHTPLGFGQYRHLTPSEIADFDTQYLVWVKETIINRGMLISDVLYKECKKSPTENKEMIKKERFLSTKNTNTQPKPQKPPYQAGSLAESRSHLDSYNDPDEVSF